MPDTTLEFVFHHEVEFPEKFIRVDGGTAAEAIESMMKLLREYVEANIKTTSISGVYVGSETANL